MVDMADVEVVIEMDVVVLVVATVEERWWCW